MSDAERRIGNSEREAAVVALQVHLNAGRLSSSEYEDRSIQARQARTRADFEPLFADLPRPHPDDETKGPASTPVSVTSTEPAATQNTTPSSGSHAGPVSESPGGLLPGPVGAWVMSLIPFAALLLFFATGHHWQWFLLIPIAGVLVRGPHGGHGHRGRARGRLDR
ncbi:MAG TPA: DUF1707 domain-containing protein [Kineosporiaceae bacterium]|nr:DUF1707 domain-containing protein [Kineosporiaceae bacterium]